MNRLREAGITIAATGILLAGCSTEQASYPDSNSISTSSTSEYPAAAPTTAGSQAPEATTNTSSGAEIEQRLQAILGRACAYVVQQEDLAKDGFRNIWDSGSPMYNYSAQYDQLSGPQGGDPVDMFSLSLKQSCGEYANIYSRNAP